MTIAEAVRRATVTLGTAPAEARRDAAALLRGLLDWDMATWLVRQHQELPVDIQSRFHELIERRASGEPVAYLVGAKEFFGRMFRVTPAVLIPRPETELLVERALAAIDQLARSPVRVVDVGTGSGCITVTLACERPQVQVTATDVSSEALVVASENAARHEVARRVRFVQAPLTGGVADVDLVVSNPPYVPLSDRDQLMRDVRDFEPHLALFGGDDGLAVIGALAPDAARALRPGGTLLLEIGVGQAAAVRTLLEWHGFLDVRVHADLAGVPRVVEARAAGASV